MKLRKSGLAVLGLSAGILFMSHAQAAGLLFLSDTAAARMSKDDFTAMTNAAVEALNDTTVPSTKVWSNPKTGAGGTVKTVQELTAGSGETCKRVEYHTQAKKLTYEASSTLCKLKDGWKLVPDDFAKAPATK